MTVLSETKPPIYYTNSDSECVCEGEECTCDLTWPDAVEAMVERVRKVVGRKKTMGRYRWIITVENFGWMGRSGYKFMSGHTSPADLLRGALPDTACTFRFSSDCNRKQVVLYNAHHDRPQGDERYTFSLVKLGSNG